LKACWAKDLLVRFPGYDRPFFCASIGPKSVATPSQSVTLKTTRRRTAGVVACMHTLGGGQVACMHTLGGGQRGIRHHKAR